ncbi:MAG: hypothetical protein H6922_04035 [Pseudomonadaceae bacterium]|nr:hypothetical protein [Pseudomonadaceae bacterium]
MIDIWDIIDGRAVGGRRVLEYEVRGRDRPFVVIPAIGLLEQDSRSLTPLVREILSCDNDRCIPEMVHDLSEKKAWGGKANKGLFLCDEGRDVAKHVAPTDGGYLVCMTKFMELEGNCVRPNTQLIVLTADGGWTITGCDIRTQDVPDKLKFWKREDGSGTLSNWAENHLPMHRDRTVQEDYRETLRTIHDVCKRHGSRLDMGDDNWTLRPHPEVPARKYENPALSVSFQTHIPIPIDPVTGGEALNIESLLEGCETHPT